MTCASVPLQRLLAEEFHLIRQTTRPQINEILSKRALAVQYLEQYNFTVLEGTSTFYIFTSHNHIGNVDDIFLELLEHGVAVVPGSGYGNSYCDFMRISVGTETIERIRKAIDMIVKVGLMRR